MVRVVRNIVKRKLLLGSVLPFERSSIMIMTKCIRKPWWKEKSCSLFFFFSCNKDMLFYYLQRALDFSCKDGLMWALLDHDILILKWMHVLLVTCAQIIQVYPHINVLISSHEVRSAMVHPFLYIYIHKVHSFTLWTYIIS